MLLLNENFEGFDDISRELFKNDVRNDPGAKKTNRLNNIYYWAYNTDEKDFFLRNSVWFTIDSDAYLVEIDGESSYIPSSYFIIIGDYEVGFDIISPKEIVGREFSALMFNHDLQLSKKIFGDIKVVGYKESYNFIYPLTNDLIPVKIGKRCILTSSKNVYSRLKNLSFTDFI